MKYAISRVISTIPKTQTEKDKHLLTAAEKGHTERFNRLLKSGANVNTSTSIGFTPLHTAILNGHKEIINVLLNNKDVNIIAKSVAGYTPLHTAAFKGDIGTAIDLLDKGIDIDPLSNSRSTPLHLASQEGHPDMVEFLIDSGANKEAVDKDNITALHFAAANGKTETVMALLNWGADKKAIAVDNNTALGIAKKRNHVGAIAVLSSEHKIDVNEIAHLDANPGRLDGLRSPSLPKPLKDFRKRQKQKRKRKQPSLPNNGKVKNGFMV